MAARFDWRSGGSAAILARGELIATPVGFVATLKFTRGYAVCWSPNLVDWYPPDASHLVVKAGRPFYPLGTVQVKKGYGAVAVADPVGYDEVGGDELAPPVEYWYSADGITWTPGLAKSLISAPTPASCLEGAGEPICLYAGPLIIQTDGSSASTNGGRTWRPPTFPANLMVMLDDVQQLSDKTYVATATVRDMLWTPPPCDRCVYADEAGQESAMLASQDGLKWRRIPRDHDGQILARPDGLFLLDTDGVLWLSKDNAATWARVRGNMGARMVVVGGHLVTVASVRTIDMTATEYILWIQD